MLSRVKFPSIKPDTMTAGVLAALWAVSLLLPVAIMGAAKDNVFPGWGILMMGWLGVLVLQFGWFANPVFVAALVLLATSKRRTGWATLVSVLLACLIADALTWHEMYGDNGSVPIQAFGAGYYLWLATMIGAAVTLAWPFGNKAFVSRHEG
jgi:hypothetical protein